MKLSNKILIGLLIFVILFQFFAMLKFRSFVKDAMVSSNNIDRTLWNDLMDSEIIEEEFDLDDFDEVYLKFHGNAIIKQSDEFKVTVKGPKDFLSSEYFEIANQGNTLHIECPVYRHSHYEIFTIIEMPSIKKINGQERLDIIFQDFEEDKVKIKIAGDCAIQGNNNAIEFLELDSFGEIKFDFANSVIKEAEVRAMGETDVRMKVTDIDIKAFGESDFDLHMNGGKLDGQMIGDGDVTYTGDIGRNFLKFIGPGKVRRR